MKIYGTGSIPLEAQYLYRRAVERMAESDHELAVSLLRQATFIAPGYSQAYQEMAVCLGHLGRPEEAEFCYRKALRQGAGTSWMIIDGVAKNKRGSDSEPLLFPPQLIC